jgi:hypothetical protein
LIDRAALGGVEESTSVSVNGHACEFGTERDGGEACAGSGTVKFGHILLCERHAKEMESGERADHWSEATSTWTCGRRSPGRGRTTPSRGSYATPGSKPARSRTSNDGPRSPQRATDGKRRPGTRDPRPAARRQATGESQQFLTESLP